MKQKIRILLADDHKMVRQGFRLILASQDDMDVVGETGDGRDAVELAKTLKPNVVVMDITMPELNGIEACHRMSRVVPAAKIIFVTQNNDAETVRAALSNGASGYVLKLDANNELLPAVKAVLQGDRFVSTRVKHGGGIAPSG